MKSTKTIRLRLLLLWSIMPVFLICTNTFAQTTKISGTVINQRTSAPASGATITVKNTNRSTTVGDDGKFSIEASKGDVLIITMVGFQKTQVVVKSSTIEIKLTENAVQLDDVVVIGYGKSKRKDLTGGISSVSGAELRKTSPTTFDQALQGKVAGVVVQQISGQPGGGVSIQVHGVSSISGSNSPLYVIDGVIIPPTNDPGNGANPLNAINPSEIESIDVLKDASATAIYGSQATNGVIVITTKRGSVAPPQISYDGYYGYQKLPKKLPTVNLQQLASFINDRAAVWTFDERPEFANPKYLGTGTDWQNELFRTAPMQNHSLAINGGDARTQYLFSLGYFDQDGIALGSRFKRYSVRLNLDNKTTIWLKIGTSLQLANVVENVNSSSAGVISSALWLTPDIPVKNVDGTWGGVTNNSGWVQPVVNPVAMALINKNMNYRYQIFGNAYAEINFTKELSLRNEVSGNFDFFSNEGFRPQTTFGKYTTPDPTISSYSSGQNIYTIIRNYLTYNKSFGKNNLNVLLGHESNMSKSANVFASRSDFPSGNVQSISSGDPSTARNNGGYGDGASESYFGRINFNWVDKYLFTFNLRNDGSDKFPTDKRWAASTSGAFAWKINNEKFLQNVKPINELKLRLGYGLTNNQNIPANTYVTQLSTIANGLSGTAQWQSNLPNPNVKWEQTKNGNIGLDGAFFNWRLNFSIDVYDRKTDGLLLKVPLPAYSGTTAAWSPGAMQAPYVNVGSMSNKGIDIRVGTTNIRNKNFSWKTDITVSRNINKVVYLGSGGDDASLVSRNSKTVVGRSIGSFYGYIYDGVFATADDFKNHALPADQSGNPRPIANAGGGIWYGDRMFKDLNGDGIIDTRDQTFLGSPLPRFQFGFNNSFNYKGFDLNIFFSGNVGNKVYNQLPVNQTNPLNNTNYFTGILNYAKTDLIDHAGDRNDVNNVYVTNPNTTIVSLRNDNTNENGRFSNLFLEDASFIRCKNITIGYNLPQNILAKAHIYSLRVYANVSNAFTITKYTGMDPEVGSWNPLEAGYDGGYYPQSRVFTFGVNVKLTK
ncbi:SusC/RagA family TonB-linked outer membrane protein [Terrimonas pollutisoli]|uniref:SusC/RagA family TonB-linked outer membrane protein n=1 Tax=Terrimonas pollutisoli TaxID=3034147 RepID=UPI0023EC7E4B|nr:TonB-dependent receptor [Terrimonas sp. H1YJ31]